MNKPVLDAGRTYPNGRATRVECCGLLKKDGLQQVIEHYGYTGVIVGVRRDEDPTRAKERYFSPRNANNGVERVGSAARALESVQDRFRARHAHPHPPAARLDRAQRLGVHRAREHPGHSLYFDDGTGQRYRSLGCAPCTVSDPVHGQDRGARSSPSFDGRTSSERAGRAQDQESEDAFEKLRRDGYM